MEEEQAKIIYIGMEAKHIKINICIIVIMVIGVINSCAAQDTICAEGILGEIIKNPDGTFYYSSSVQLIDGGCFTTFSYGRWQLDDDGIITFVSSINTKHQILKSYEMCDSVSVTTSMIVDVYNENGDLLCTSDDANIHFYAESSILGITICDTTIKIHGVRPYGQWHLCSNIKETTHNHHIIVIRDAFYYDLVYLHLSLVQNGTGIWQLLRTFEEYEYDFLKKTD